MDVSIITRYIVTDAAGYTNIFRCLDNALAHIAAYGGSYVVDTFAMDIV